MREDTKENIYMNELQQINDERAQALEEIELADALDKLLKNRAYKKVFDEHIFKTLPASTARFFNKAGLPDHVQKNLENTLGMVSTLQDTLSTILAQGNAAHSKLKELTEVEAEYLAESEE